MFKHILIPTDGSALSRAAAAAGIELAAKIGARVTGLFAAPAPTPIVYRALLPVGYMTPDEHAELTRRAAKKFLDAIDTLARRAGVKCECVSVTDEYPANAILETARKRRCDLIFMASHGRRSNLGMMLGSQTLKVVMSSEIPVLIAAIRNPAVPARSLGIIRDEHRSLAAVLHCMVHGHWNGKLISDKAVRALFT